MRGFAPPMPHDACGRREAEAHAPGCQCFAWEIARAIHEYEGLTDIRESALARGESVPHPTIAGGTAGASPQLVQSVAAAVQTYLDWQRWIDQKQRSAN